MEISLEASNLKTAEIAGRLTFADVSAGGNDEMFCGTSFAAMRNARNSNPESEDQGVTEMMSHFCVDEANSSDSTSTAADAASTTKTDDGMGVGIIAEAVTEAVLNSADGREKFAAFATGKPRDGLPLHDLRIHLTNNGVSAADAMGIARHLGRMIDNGFDFAGMVNLPRQEFHRRLRDGLREYAVNRPNS